MYGVVVEDLVVDFVGEQNELVLARKLDHAFEHFLGVDRAGGVVRVDQHQCLGVRRDLGLDIGQVRPPVGLLVAKVVHRLAAGQAHRSGPQRVIRGRDQHFIAIVQQCLHGHDDQLGHTVAEVDVFDADAFNLLLLVVLHDRLAGAEQAFGVAVALGSGQVADHVLEDFLRCFETERRRVADVQLEDAMAFLFQAFGVLEHGPADVVTDIGKLVRFADLHDPECPEVKTRQFRKWLAALGMNPGALAVGNPAARLGVEEGRMIRAPRPPEKVQIGLF